MNNPVKNRRNEFRKLIFIFVSISALCLPVIGCGGNTDVEKDGHTEYLKVGETWKVKDQWELTLLRVFHMGANKANVTVQYQLTNINCAVITEGYKGLVIIPHIYNSPERETEYQPTGIEAWTSRPGSTINKNRISVTSVDGVTPIELCYVVFFQTADDDITYTAVFVANP